MQLYTSNRAELLVGQLAEVLRRPSGGPFDPEVVLVHSPGMSAWLRQRIANDVGICANVRFPFPANYLPELFGIVLGDDAKGSENWTRSRLRWAVLADLPPRLVDPDFASVRGYLLDKMGKVDALKLMQLSERIARVFAGYLFHRPDMIAAWQDGAPGDDARKTERWQAKLWNGVRERLNAKSVVDLSRAFRDEINALQKADASPTEKPAKPKSTKKAPPQLTLDLFGAPAGAEDEVAERGAGAGSGRTPSASALADLPSRVCLFGVSSLPPLQLELMGALSKLVEVHAFVLSPSKEFFADIRDQRSLARRAAKTGRSPEEEHLEIGNPLLASLGKLGRDFQHLLYDRDLPIALFREDFEDPLLPPEAEDGAVQPTMFPATPSALRVVQSDILNLRHRGHAGALPGERVAPFELDKDDRSIAIHACHGPMRQVEALHDQILDMFRRDETLDPADVVVMCPDLETYGPLVEAVFSRVGEDPRNVPFRIADRSLRRDSPVAEAFLGVLDVVDGRFAAPDIMDLLSMPMVHRRFGISPDTLPRIASWVGDTGIRWGIDPEHREAHGQPPYTENTWRFGLDRMLVGMALPGEDRKLYAGVLPFDPIEGSDAQVVGKLAEFCTQLFAESRDLQHERSLSEWAQVLERMLDRMVSLDDDVAWEHEQIRGILSDAAQESSDAGVQTPLPLIAVRSWLRTQLTEGRSPYGFLTGAVTFCEMLPMRAIPFRVVCMLGMDERAFPRNGSRIGFDLVAQQPERGDRNARDDDRYLFLEALLSARERVLITHTGLSARDNSALPPSVLVSELLDVCTESFAAPASRFVTTHALQPFSERYFRSDDPLFTYAHEFHSGAESLRATPEGPRPFLTKPAPLEEPIHAVTVSELVRFFRNPVRAFFNRRLQVYLGDDEAALLAREPVMLDRLESSILAGRMLDRAVEGEDPESGYASTRAAGSLPLGEPGSIKHEAMAKSVGPLDRAIGLVRGIHDPDTFAVDLDVDGVALSGRVNGVFGGNLVVHQYSRVRGDHELAVWVQHVILCAAAGPRESTLIGRPSPNDASVRYGSQGLDVRVTTYSAPGNPMGLLRTLVELYRAGMEEPLLLFPRTSMVWEELEDNKAQWRQAYQTWEGPWGLPGERDNPYAMALMQGQAPFRMDAANSPLGALPSRHDLRFKPLAKAVFGPLLAHRGS